MKTSGIKMADVNPKFHAQIAAQLDGLQKKFPNAISTQTNYAGAGIPGAQKPAIRQDRTGLNKTEAAFLEYLRAAFPHFEVLEQAVTLKLGNGVRYTPDFFVWTLCGCEAWEVKGFMRDDANVKLKVAASKYPWITFYLVRRQGKTGGWDIQRILP